MPILLENRMTSASESDFDLCMSEMTRPSSSSVPLWVSTMSVGRARPLSSNEAATKGLSVEPGSNGSVTAVFENAVRPTLLLASARISPVCGFITTMSPPSARRLSTAIDNSRSQMSCSVLLIVSTTVDPAFGWSVHPSGESSGRPSLSRASLTFPESPRSSVSSASSSPSSGFPCPSRLPTMRLMPPELA